MLVLASIACGRDSGPVGPKLSNGPRPVFDVQPSVPSDTGCARNTAWIFSSHFTSGSVAFYSPGSETPRTQCGALPFDEDSTSPGHVTMQWHLGDSDQWQRWARDLRSAQDGTVASDTTLGDAYYHLAPDTVATFDAPANPRYDMVAFAHHRAKLHSDLTGGEVNAKAQLWRAMAAPSDLGA